jgi:serine protease AprX
MSRYFKSIATAVLGVSLAVPLVASAAPAHALSLTQVIIQTDPDGEPLVEFAVESLGGEVEQTLASVDAVVATVPVDEVDALEVVPGVVDVTTDASLYLLDDVAGTLTAPLHPIGGSLFGDDADVRGLPAADDPGSLYNTARLVNADRLWRSGVTGAGIDVAVIDSGVSPVPGLNDTGKLVYGPDLSFDSQAANLRHFDGYGHGTHMAGIIASRDTGIARPENAPADAAVGIAPGARVVSMKVAAADGSTDVSQVIAAIDWVVQHKRDNGMNIRVLNLSFGTDGVQSYLLDPLTYAVEVAWRNGIVVVVAAGNDGATSPLNNPAYDPFVIAVGASDHRATLGPGDDTVAEFSSRGTAARRPDLTAPGRSITSLRDPQSFVDEMYPSAVVRDRFFRGSGSSQAAAVTSGAVALLLQARPSLTPDQVKQVLVRGAAPLASSGVAADRGIERLDVGASAWVLPLFASQPHQRSAGTGSIDAARGTRIELVDEGVALDGEVDVHGMPWPAGRWASAAAALRSWSGGWWNGTEWTGSTWSTDGWEAAGWSGRTWTGRTWTGRTWSGRTWTGRTWTDAAWTGRTWTGRTWTGRTWTGRTWTGRTWTATQY